ncbi:MAG: ThiF family adenylyltransferase [Candidatus Thorarchaeota archaeon]
MTLVQEGQWNYWQSFDRNIGILTRDEQERISEVVVAQAGTGGNSDVVLTLAQMGFRKFRLADPDVFEASNMNRQLGATIDTLGRNKAQVIAEEILRMNPDAEVQVFEEGVTLENVHEFLDGADLVVDGLDSHVMHVRKALFDTARSLGQPVFSSPATGWGAALGVFDPVRSPSFTEFFGEVPEDLRSPEGERFVVDFVFRFISSLPTGLDLEFAKSRAREGKNPVVAAACRQNAALVCTAIYAWLFDRGRIPIVPTTIFVDLLGGRIIKTGPKKRAVLSLLKRLFLGA